jgi:hypothetical protein
MRPYNGILYLGVCAAGLVWYMAFSGGEFVRLYLATGSRRLPDMVVVLMLLHTTSFLFGILLAIRTMYLLSPLWSGPKMRMYDPKRMAFTAAVLVMAAAFEYGFERGLVGNRASPLPLMVAMTLLACVRIEFIIPPRAVPPT